MLVEKLKIDNLISIVKCAGDKILDIYNSDIQEWDISVKGDNSPLTKADKVSNNIICSNLEKIDSSIPIISEENKEVPYNERKNYEYFWLIDPLDGTKEFIKRNGEFTVNLALIKRNKAIFGIVYAPFLELLYWANEGKGAFKVDSNNNSTRINANKFSLRQKNLRIVSSRSHMNEETKNFIQNFENPQNVSMGSSLKLMLIAEGKADIYPRLGPTMEWDTAASQIIVEEAGGEVIRYEDKMPFVYNKENLLNDYFIAKGKVLD